MGFEPTTSCLGSWFQARLFVNTRKATKGLTPSGEKWLIEALHTFSKAIPNPVNEVTKEHLINFMGDYQDKPWRRHGLYRALKTFFKWVSTEYGFDNPMASIAPPKTPDPVLHTITPDDVDRLIAATDSCRNKAIIALLADSGVRRSELAAIRLSDVELDRHRIKVSGKGGKEEHLIFGNKTKDLLERYIKESDPPCKLFDLNSNGVQTMLKRLEKETGIRCNAHSFRRGFATALRRASVGERDIQQLGRWSSLEMVRRYTKAFTFDDAAERYKPIVT